jgi:hypothetical protein
LRSPACMRSPRRSWRVAPGHRRAYGTRRTPVTHRGGVAVAYRQAWRAWSSFGSGRCGGDESLAPAALYDTSPLAGGVYLATAGVLLLALAAASYLPVRRALGVSPAEVLRSE